MGSIILSGLFSKLLSFILDKFLYPLKVTEKNNITTIMNLLDSNLNFEKNFIKNKIDIRTNKWWDILITGSLKINVTTEIKEIKKNIINMLFNWVISSFLNLIWVFLKEKIVKMR